MDGLVGGSEMLIADLRDFIGVEAAKKGEARAKASSPVSSASPAMFVRYWA